MLCMLFLLHESYTLTQACQDLTNAKSFEGLAKWLVQAHKYSDTSTRLIVVGNKCDLTSQINVSPSEISTYVTAEALEYVETSAKEGTNVDFLFEHAAMRCLEFNGIT